jgi:hypothetical protein
VEGASGGNIVDMNHILQSIVPVGLGEFCIEEHRSDLVKKGPVHVLSNTIVLWGVMICQFMFDPLLSEVLWTLSVVYSPPPSEWRIWMVMPISTSAPDTKALSASSTLSLRCNP